jgi:hypothetical protein
VCRYVTVLSIAYIFAYSRFPALPHMEMDPT